MKLIGALLIVALLAAPAWAKTAFVDPITGELKSWGFTGSQGTDTAVPVPDDFALEPGKWRWNGSAWVTYNKPPPPDPRADLKAAIDAILSDNGISPRVREAFRLLKESLK